MKQVIFLAVIVALAGCAGPKRYGKPTPRVMFATGPIYSACMSSDRKARSRALCGCIQAVANTDLTAGDQRVVATFWDDPQKVQDIRQSDRPNNERLWRSYKAYGGRVERLCG